jgi:hypothetical protein
MSRLRVPAALHRPRTWRRAAISAALVAIGLRSTASGAEPPKAPVPKSPFIPVIYRYADAMLEHGRDNIGPQKTGLFFSALDRTTLEPLTVRPPAPRGVRELERAGSSGGALTGANAQHDENLLRLLYMLTELSTKTKYREAADAELKWFLAKIGSEENDLWPWGRSASWDLVKDEPIVRDNSARTSYAFFRPWMLWDRCFELAREPSKKCALAAWQQISGRMTAAARRIEEGAGPNVDLHDINPRQTGFLIRTWAVAYAQTKDAQFLAMIKVLVESLEEKRAAQTGLLARDDTFASRASILSLAVDCDGASHRLPEPLASQLRTLAAREDDAFCARAPAFPVSKDSAPPLWLAPENAATSARIGMLCVSRYENTGRVAYLELLHAAAQAYLHSMPGEDDEVWAGTLGQAISLQLAAWRSTADPVYFNRAREFGEFALQKFFDSGPLPRASLKSEQYESVTGVDTLALALVELHLEILHITAVRYPPNTIDR